METSFSSVTIAFKSIKGELSHRKIILHTLHTSQMFMVYSWVRLYTSIVQIHLSTCLISNQQKVIIKEELIVLALLEINPKYHTQKTKLIHACMHACMHKERKKYFNLLVFLFFALLLLTEGQISGQEIMQKKLYRNLPIICTAREI